MLIVISDLHHLGQELPPGIIEGLGDLVNVRPALATPLWISGQLRQNNVSLANQKKIKNVWDDMSDEFLALPFVRAADEKFKWIPSHPCRARPTRCT